MIVQTTDLFGPTMAEIEPAGLVVTVVPLVVAWLVWIWRLPDRTEQGAVALATLWNTVWLIVVNVAAVEVGWWRFADVPPRVGPLPLGLMLGWILLWGVVGPLLRTSPAATVAGFGVIDLLAMPRLEGIVELGPRWLLGEALLLGFVALPGLLLARWTADRTNLAWRARLQFLLFSVLLAWLIPWISAAAVGATLRPAVPVWGFGVVAVIIGLCVIPGLISVHEFFLAGGTPWPFDPPPNLVRSGPSIYMRSPMQTSAISVLAVGAAVYQLPTLLLAAAMGLAYSWLFCRLEHDELGRRFGSAWPHYASTRRRWLPHGRPSESGSSAVLWVRRSCQSCWPVARFFLARRSTNLSVRPAEDHPDHATDPLTRVRYEREDGVQFAGVPAVGAGLEHLHLGWALLGWTLRMPVVWRWWQLVADAAGFGPMQTETGSQPVATTPVSR